MVIGLDCAGFGITGAGRRRPLHAEKQELERKIIERSCHSKADKLGYLLKKEVMSNDE